MIHWRDSYSEGCCVCEEKRRWGCDPRFYFACLFYSILHYLTFLIVSVSVSAVVSFGSWDFGELGGTDEGWMDLIANPPNTKAETHATPLHRFDLLDPLWILKRPTSRSFSLSLLSQAAGNHVAHTRTYTIPLVVLRVSSWVTREKKFWGTGHLTVQSDLISIATFSRSIGTLAWLSPDRVRCFCFLAGSFWYYEPRETEVCSVTHKHTHSSCLGLVIIRPQSPHSDRDQRIPLSTYNEEFLVSRSSVCTHTYNRYKRASCLKSSWIQKRGKGKTKEQGEKEKGRVRKE